MRKRILSLLMAVAMVVSMLPTMTLPVSAAETEVTHDHTDSSTTTWKDLSSSLPAMTNSEHPLDSGNYYLSGDLSIWAPIRINGEVNLCLNDFKLRTDWNAIVISEDATLNLYDCGDSTTKYFVEKLNSSNGRTYWREKATEDTDDSIAGSVTGGVIVCFATGINNCGVEVESGGTFNMYGGGIVGFDDSGVCVTAGGTFNMTGGSIAGNYGQHGGGVYINGGSFSMSGNASIHDNVSNYDGGGISCTNESTAAISGSAEIINNEANKAGMGYYGDDIYHSITGGENLQLNGGSPDIGSIYCGLNTSRIEVTGAFAEGIEIPIEGAANPFAIVSDELNAEDFEDNFIKKDDTTGEYQTVATANNELAFYKYRVTVDELENGTVTADPAGGDGNGETITLTVTPGSGFELEELTVINGSGDKVTVDTTYNTFTMPASDVTVSATFKATTTSVKVSAVSGTGIKILEGTTEVASWEADAEAHEVTGLKYGSSYTVNATGLEGYEDFEGTLTVGTDGSISFGGATLTNGVYQLNLTAKTYKINAESAGGSEVNTNPSDEAKYGETVTITPLPDIGYGLDDVKVINKTTQTEVDVVNNTFTMPASDVTITPTFSKVDYTVTLNGATSYITNASEFEGKTANYQDTITLTVADVPFGYKLSFVVKLSAGGTVDVTAPANGSVNGEYTFTMPASNVTITATYGIDTGFVCVDEDQALYKNGDDYYQLDDDTDKFTLVHVHESNGKYTVYQLWDGTTDISTAGNYALSANVTDIDGSIDIIADVSLCLNGHSHRYLKITSTTVIDNCSSNNTGYIRTLMVENAAVTLNGITVNGLSNFGNQGTSAVTVNGGSIDSIANLEASGSTTLNLDGNLVIKGTDSEPGIYVGPNTKIYLGENFAGTNGKTGEGVDTRITVGEAVNGDDLTFGETWTFIHSGATEQNKDMFVYEKTAAQLKDGVTTEIQTVLDEENGTLSFKAVHIHNKGTADEIVFDKALDASVDNGSFGNGNYVVTVANPYDADADFVGIDVKGNVKLCLNGMDCSNSSLMAMTNTTSLEIYDHADGNGKYLGGLWTVWGMNGAAVTIYGGNYLGQEILINNGSSLTFHDGTAYSVHGLATSGDVTIDVKGGVIGQIVGVETSNKNLTINLSGSPVIKGDASFTVGAFTSNAHILLTHDVVLNIDENFNGSADGDGEKITVQFCDYGSGYVTHEISTEKDIVFAQGTDLSEYVNTFAYYDSDRNVTVVLSDDKTELSFHLVTITVDGEEVEAIDKDNDGIYEDEDGYEVYIPTGKDNNNPTYIEVEKNEDDYTKDETTGVYNDNDGVFEDEEGNRYIPVDTDDPKDGKADDSLVDKAPADGIFEDDQGNKYVPDGDDEDTDPDKVIDNGNGTYTDPGKDGVVGTDDDVNYIPDQDGDGEAEKDDDNDGIYDGTKDETEYIPDADGDGEAETDDDGDGIFEGSEDGESYIPDQDGDNIPEKEKEDEPGIFEGSDEEKDKDYVVDPDKEPPYVEVEKDEESGVYVDPEDDDKYIPDQDDDGYAEKEKEDEPGIFEGTKDETEYIPDVDGDGEAETDDDGDGIFEGSEDGENYIPDQDGDNIPEKEKEDEPGIFEGSDEEKDKDYVVDPDKEPPYVEAEKDEESGVYEPVDDEDEDKYIPDQDGDGYAEKDDDDNGIYEGSNDDLNKDYISNGNGGFMEYIPYYPPVKPPVHDCPSKAFSDVNTELWYHEAIDFVLLNGYMNGMGNGLFQPNSKLNRAMIVQVLYNMENRPEVEGGSGFTDVADTAWYADAIAWAASNGIVNGYGDTFGPNDPITREQMAAILYRYAAYKGIDVTERGDLSIFKDGDKTSSWASDAMRWAIKVGLMSGKGDGILDPTGTATRAEVAQTLMNYCTKILNK